MSNTNCCFNIIECVCSGGSWTVSGVWKITSVPWNTVTTVGKHTKDGRPTHSHFWGDIYIHIQNAPCQTKEILKEFETGFEKNKDVLEIGLFLFVCPVRSDGAQFFLSWSWSAEHAELQTDAQWLCDTQTAEPEQEVGKGICTRSGEMQVIVTILFFSSSKVYNLI